MSYVRSSSTALNTEHCSYVKHAVLEFVCAYMYRAHGHEPEWQAAKSQRLMSERTQRVRMDIIKKRWMEMKLDGVHVCWSRACTSTVCLFMYEYNIRTHTDAVGEWMDGSATVNESAPAKRCSTR